MGLFNFVEQDDGIGFAPDLFRQLPGLVIADIARRRADNPGDGMLFHKLRHIEPDQGLGRVEQLAGEHFHKLGFAHARGAGKDKGHGAFARRKGGAGAADGRCDCVNGLVLALDLFPEDCFQVFQFIGFAAQDPTRGYARPQFNDARKVFDRHFCGGFFFQRVLLGLVADPVGFEFGNTLVRRFVVPLRCLLFERLQLFVKRGHLFAEQIQLV